MTEAYKCCLHVFASVHARVMYTYTMNYEIEIFHFLLRHPVE